MDEYSKELSKLFEGLMKALSRDLGLKNENSLNESVGGERKVLYMRMIIRLHDQTPGLQICKDGGWIDVECVPGALIVNIADQMEILSNGKYKSIEHRGMVHKDCSRMSVAMFCTPRHESVVSPRRELIDAEHPRSYQGASFTGVLCHVQSQNTDFNNWNRVMVRYCGGSSFTGDFYSWNRGSIL